MLHQLLQFSMNCQGESRPGEPNDMMYVKFADQFLAKSQYENALFYIDQALSMNGNCLVRRNHIHAIKSTISRNLFQRDNVIHTIIYSLPYCRKRNVILPLVTGNWRSERRRKFYLPTASTAKLFM